MSISRLHVDRATIGERVASALRDELLAGAFPPGAPLRDGELAERAGVARSTVREALAQLAREGLLTHTINRGMEVRRIAREDLKDIYAAREVIEIAGLTAIVKGRASSDRLGAAFEQMRAGGSVAAVADADIEFHLALAGATGSRRLAEAQLGMLKELRLVLAVTDRAYDSIDVQVDSHRELLDLIAAGSLPVARAALEAHLRSALELVSAQVDRAS
ncbi:MAG: GntR family transcriptional regulator [Actinomycetota bacterium]|nr:GntR family transcriptional regulator [Actinomycetota bacterium]